MKIIVDGIIFELQQRGGILRIFREILPKMCALDESLDIDLLTFGVKQQALPAHERIALHSSLSFFDNNFRPTAKISRLLGRHLCLQNFSSNDRDAIWHSSYYTTPKHWRGPVILTVADLIHERLKGLFAGRKNDDFRERRKRSITQADAVICISEATSRDLQEFYGIKEDKIYVTHLACSDVFGPLEEEKASARQAGGEKPFLLYIGTRVHYKNFDTLINTYSQWSKKNDIRLICVGPPWSLNEQRCLESLGIRKDVELFSDVEDKDLCRLYNQAIAFIYPSLYEGFGIPLLEAMACGCPIIASNIPSTVEIAGDCPVYFEPDNTEDCLRALDVIVSEEKSSQRVKAGFERKKTFSWNKTAEKTLEVYRKVSVAKKETV